MSISPATEESRNSSVRAKSLSRSDVGVLGFAAVIAIGLIAFGLQRVIASAFMANAVGIVEKIEVNEPVTAEELDTLLQAQERTLTIMPTPRGWSNLGIAFALQASQLPSDAPQRPLLLTEAVDALRHSLELAPISPYVWTRLALLQSGLAHPDLALQYFRMSVMTGPDEPSLYAPRIALAVALWPLLEMNERSAAFTQMRQAWHYDKWPFINLVVRLDAVNIARAALVSDLNDFKEFNSMLPKGK